MKRGEDRSKEEILPSKERPGMSLYIEKIEKRKKRERREREEREREREKEKESFFRQIIIKRLCV